MRAREGMDLRAPAHYVRCPMQFLLTLFALLSAATGALAGVRAPHAEVHQTVQTERAAEAGPRLAQAARAAPARVHTAYAAPARPARQAAQVLAAAIPLYVDRLIE
jgi:hypothetical protein